MTKQEQFFYDNAGYSYNSNTETAEQGHERCAKELANAESWAVLDGYTFRIEPDPDADESWLDDETEDYQREWRGAAWWCRMLDADGTVVQSLGGCYGYSDYERVVKAELAFEQLAAVETELKAKADCERMMTC